MPLSDETITQALFADYEPQTFERIECRYLLRYPQAQDTILRAWSTMTNTYRVKTIYFDTFDGTWTKGKVGTKIRLRNYDNEATWWIELKSHELKLRRMFNTTDLSTLERLQAVGAVSYTRSEFESPDTSPGLRVTVDTDLTSWQLPDIEVALSMHGHWKPVAKMLPLVLETKSEARFPKWLPVPRAWGGCKSRWCVAALSGKPNTIAPSIAQL
jgi:hypothetical protein